MKVISAKPVRAVQLKTRLICADNSGAKVLGVITVRRYGGILRRIPKAGVGDVVICSVVKGKENLVGKVVHAVVVRQKKGYKRKDGIHVKFTDNAAVLINPKTMEPQGTEIRTVIAKEVVERFSTIGKIASIVL